MNYIAYPDLATNSYYKPFINKLLTEKNIKQSVVNPEIYFNLISEKLGVSKDLLKSKSRKREIVEARQLFFALLKRDSTYSLASIGKLLNRDHATVLHSLRAVRDLNDKSFLNKKKLFF